MHSFIKAFATLALVVLSAAPAFAAPASPIGQWEVTTGEARYKVTSCGPEGRLLCAKLVWLRADQRNKENLALLNSYLVKGARVSDDNEWSGDVVFDGQAYQGTLTLLSRNFMKLRGCAGFLCQTYEFTRI